MYDIAIVGLGPAGATLARLLGTDRSVVAFDRKSQSAGRGFQKPCGGLLAPDAQRALAEMDISLPCSVLAGPQLFAVKTIDLPSGLSRSYPRQYINLNRQAFDRWLVESIPPGVTVHAEALCLAVERRKEHFVITWKQGGRVNVTEARYVVGADGASSLVRRSLLPPLRMRRYLAIQQWFHDTHPSPFYACVFDRENTDCYAWGLSKNESFLFGGAFAPHAARRSFESLKKRVEPLGFRLRNPVKSEACAVLRPLWPGDMQCGEKGCFLLGEAGGFISPSSLEGFSYAFDSARKLAALFNADTQDLNRAYVRAMRGLRLKIMGKIIKSPFLFSPPLRRLIMQSGLGSLARHV